MFLNRNSQCVVNRPSVFDAAKNRGWLNPSFSSPLRQALSSAFKGQQAGLLFVVVLLFQRGPFAVVQRIAEIVILPLYRIAIAGSRSHIGKELRKAGPRFAHCDTTRPIVFVFRMVRVAASLVHGLPRDVLRRARHSVLGQPIMLNLSMETPARNIRPTQQRGSIGNLLVSTITTAEPISCLVTNEGNADGRQSIELSTSNIMWRHKRIITAI